MTKKELRTELRQRRASIAADDRRLFDMLIFEMAHKIKAYQQAERVHVYVSGPSEVESRPLIDYAIATGKQVFVPCDGPDDRPYHVAVVAGQRWTTGRHGIAVPLPDDGQARAVIAGEVDVVIVPVVGFDRACHRLGQGGGYYDRLLQNHHGMSIGLAYACQRTDDIPTEQHDVALTCVVTEERLYVRPPAVAVPDGPPAGVPGQYHP